MAQRERRVSGMLTVRFVRGEGKKGRDEKGRAL